MFRFLKIVILISLNFACSENKSGPQNIKNNDEIQSLNGLYTELYMQLLNYQKEYPIPKQESTKYLYVYDAQFRKVHDDTLLLIVRRSEGIWLSSDSVWKGNESFWGVYRDSILQPTIIRDSKEKYGKNFIKKYVIDSISLKAFEPRKNYDYPESFPPIYEYKVKGTRLLLNKIDTVWTKWR